MENIIYSSPETAPVDNLTIIKRLPYGFRSGYYATNYGQILFLRKGVYKPIRRRVKCNNKTILRGSADYQRIHCNGPLQGKFAHRLIAEAFCTNSNPLRNQVDHIDNNPANNRADNLRWCTQIENCRYAREIRTGERIITNLQKSLFYVTQ